MGEKIDIDGALDRATRARDGEPDVRTAADVEREIVAETVPDVQIAERVRTMTVEAFAAWVGQLEQLRKPFEGREVGKLPKLTCGECKKKYPDVCGSHAKTRCAECGQWMSPAHIHIDYVGHAEVTDRLLDVDPFWDWEPIGPVHDPFVRNANGQAVGLWILLTIAGVTRRGYGSCRAGASEAEKELIGDAIRNAAMRFGVALDYWKKDVGTQSEPASGPQRENADRPKANPDNPAKEGQLRKIYVEAKKRDLADDVVFKLAAKKWAVTDLKALNAAQASEFIDFLKDATDEQLDAAVGKVMAAPAAS